MLSWEMTGDQILKNTELFIKKSLENNRTLLDLDIGDKNNLNTFLNVLSDDISEFTMFHSVCSFLQFVSPVESVRNASYESDTLLTKYATELNVRKNLYDKIFMFSNLIKALNYDKEDVKFVEKVLEGFKKNGVLLSEVSKEKLMKVRAEIAKLENSVSYSLHKFDNKLVGLTEEELVGLPDKFKTKLQIVTNNPLRFGICLDKFNYVNCMRFLKDPDVRRKLELCYASKSFDIIEDVSKLMVLRDKQAQILSFVNHSQFKNDKSPKNIKNFILDVVKLVDKKYESEVNMLVKLNNGKPVHSFDLQYFMHKWKKEYEISDSYVKQFFPVRHVVRSVLGVYRQIMNLRFEKMNKPNVWHSTVCMYSVYDKDDNTLIGYFYLDLYARQGKYKNVRCFCLQQGCSYPMRSTLNNKQLPIVALIASFGASLLNYGEVITFFHEFAHVLHHILGYSKYSLFSGTRVEADFVETPAQALEYLCWEKTVIKKLSRHYKTKQPLPDDKIDKLIKIRDIEIGIYVKKHSLIALFDQVIHSSKLFIQLCEGYFNDIDNKITLKESLSVAYANLYKQLYTEMFGDKIGFNEGVLFPGLWLNYLVGGDAQYYSHLWSKICAANIYYKYKSDINKFGKTVKDKILKKCGCTSAIEIYNDVLGGVPDTVNFAKLHDIDLSEEYSYYLQTDQIKNDLTTVEVDTVYTECEEYSNRFSEIDPHS